MRKRRVVTVIAIVLAAATIGVGIYNVVKNKNFWNVSVAQVLTLLVTISIAFWATQFKNDQRSAKAHAEKVIAKIQAIVSCEEFYTFIPGCNEEDAKKNYGISQRKFANCLSVLEEYGKQLGLQDDVKYIDEQFTEYKTFISDHLNDFDYLSKSEAHLRRLSENIDSKCDQIVVKFYN